MASPDLLARLQQAHVERIPWSTGDMFMGRPTPIDPRAAVALMTQGRSGYFFHLNTAFLTLLSALGFNVHAHRAGVQSRGRSPVVDGCHMGLTVHPHGDRWNSWIVDVGLGDMPALPIPRAWGRWAQGALVYETVPSAVHPRGWRLVNDERASYVGVDFAPERVPLDVFVPAHLFRSRDPASLG